MTESVIYAPALRVARWILERAAWTQRSGMQQGRGFLVDMAAVIEDFGLFAFRSVGAV